LPELLYRGGRLCDWIDITAPQQRAMLGLVFVALNKNPFADISFLPHPHFRGR
jgi:hypothetical protein